MPALGRLQCAIIEVVSRIDIRLGAAGRHAAHKPRADGKPAERPAQVQAGGLARQRVPARRALRRVCGRMLPCRSTHGAEEGAVDKRWAAAWALRAAAGWPTPA